MSSFIFECIKISKTFKQGPNSLEILNNIDFKLETSSSVGILGPSGSGKTTFLNILAGLDAPSSGKVFYKNINLNDIDDEKKASIRNNEIGFVYQFHHLLPEFTAVENVSIPMMISGIDKEEALSRSKDLLRRVSLQKRMNHKPSEISGGERQRVAIARSLANTPSCLIMDEPTGDLDSYNAESVSEVIMGLVREFDLSVVIASHDVSITQKLGKTFNMKLK